MSVWVNWQASRLRAGVPNSHPSGVAEFCSSPLVREDRESAQEESEHILILLSTPSKELIRN